MKQSIRNQLLMDMQMELHEMTGILIETIEAANDIEFTDEEVQDALKAVICSYG